MARPNPKLISSIRNAARKLEKSTDYQWGHMGSCNCGFLAQELTRLDKAEIHRRALLGSGDWTEQLNDYCPGSGIPMDDLISDLVDAGLMLEDLQNLEQLRDPRVLSHLPSGRKYLKHNQKNDVVEYMNTWAMLLEEQLLDKVDLPEFGIHHPTTEKQIS